MWTFENFCGHRGGYVFLSKCGYNYIKFKWIWARKPHSWLLFKVIKTIDNRKKARVRQQETEDASSFFLVWKFIFHQISVYPWRWIVFIHGSEKRCSVAVHPCKWKAFIGGSETGLKRFDSARPRTSCCDVAILVFNARRTPWCRRPTRHDSVGVHSATLRCLMVTHKTGCNSHFTPFRESITETIIHAINHGRTFHLWRQCRCRRMKWGII